MGIYQDDRTVRVACVDFATRKAENSVQVIPLADKIYQFITKGTTPASKPFPKPKKK